jgi:two-component system sensor histidine kinase DesK
MNELPHEIKLTYIIAIFVMLLFVGFIIVVVFIYNKKQLIQQQEIKIKESEFKNELLSKEIERQKSIQLERERISQDMHDDLGAGISAIKLQAEFLKHKIQHQNFIEDVESIITTSEDMNLAMREILWSLNSKNDTVGNFETYAHQFVEKFLKKAPISIEWNTSIIQNDANLSVKARRNLFLALKEAIHNVYKHSLASKVKVSFTQTNNKLIISIMDDGKGISENVLKGNGLKNMSLRMEKIDGKFEIRTTENGAHLVFEYPFED